MTEVEVVFTDCTAVLQVIAIETLFDTNMSMDEKGTIETRAGMVIMDVAEGVVQSPDREWTLEAGRYVIMKDGLYRRVEGW